MTSNAKTYDTENLSDEEVQRRLEQQGMLLSSVNWLYNWGRRSSVWPMLFGLACCAIEMIASATCALRYRALRLAGCFALRRARPT